VGHAIPPPENRVHTESELRSWRASLLRNRAQHLGTVEAPDERAAEAAAVTRFRLSDEQRRRLVVRAEEAE
jgi:hypothetical protein